MRLWGDCCHVINPPRGTTANSCGWNLSLLYRPGPPPDRWDSQVSYRSSSTLEIVYRNLSPRATNRQVIMLAARTHTHIHTLQQNPLAVQCWFFFATACKMRWTNLGLFPRSFVCVFACVWWPDGIVFSYMHSLHFQMHPRRILYVRISEYDQTNRIGLRLFKILYGVSAQVSHVRRQFQLHNFHNFCT